MNERELTVELVEGLEAVEHIVNLHSRFQDKDALEIILNELMNEKLRPLIVKARRKIHGFD